MSRPEATIPFSPKEAQPSSPTFDWNGITTSTQCSNGPASDERKSPKELSPPPLTGKSTCKVTRKAKLPRAGSPRGLRQKSPVLAVVEEEAKESRATLLPTGASQGTEGADVHKTVPRQRRQRSNSLSSGSEGSLRRCSKRSLTVTGALRMKPEKAEKKPGPGRPLGMKVNIPKNEELDKFWLRRFRTYMKDQQDSLRDLPPEAQAFWSYYLSPGGEPAPKSRFPSFNREYKKFIFNSPNFQFFFNTWFLENGEREANKAFRLQPNMQELYYKYAESHLMDIADIVMISEKQPSLFDEPTSPTFSLNSYEDPDWDHLLVGFEICDIEEVLSERTEFNPELNEEFRTSL